MKTMISLVAALFAMNSAYSMEHMEIANCQVEEAKFRFFVSMKDLDDEKKKVLGALFLLNGSGDGEEAGAISRTTITRVPERRMMTFSGTWYAGLGPATITFGLITTADYKPQTVKATITAYVEDDKTQVFEKEITCVYIPLN